MDIFIEPTIDFKLLFVIPVPAHERRRVIHIMATQHPAAAWIGQQFIQAFPWNTAPHCLLRNRDSIYGEPFRGLVAGMRISELLTGPRSPRQTPYVERLIGSTRPERLAHIIVTTGVQPDRTLFVPSRTVSHLRPTGSSTFGKRPVSSAAGNNSGEFPPKPVLFCSRRKERTTLSAEFKAAKALGASGVSNKIGDDACKRCAVFARKALV